MSTVTTLHAGHDVAYLTSGQRAGGCVGAMSYYTASGEPPGQWAGKAAAALGLTGQVDPAVIARLYQHNIGPGGELLVNRRQSRAARSIYRPPNEERYCSLAHLDTEQQILTAATRTAPQLVTGEQARAAAERTGLTAGQRAAVVTMLTATTATTVLVAPAGAGKSHTMAGYARLWTTFTGRRVIGLATATSAARVLQNEGLAESYNIAQFLGKIEGSGELRRPVPLHENDVLVLDEASQLATTDLAMIQEAARAAGARLVLAGDTGQLGAVEAGGMFRLLAREVPCAELHEVRRFDAAWEADASVRLRTGDFTAYAAYDRHGRMRGADQDAAMDRATSMWLADHLRGKDVLLLAGSNSEAAELSRRVQAKLIQLGAVQRPQAALADGNQAGTGDLIRARLNTTINAGGRDLANRDTLKITGWHGPHAQVRRREPDGTWTSPFLVRRAYLAGSAELDYAGNTHVGQGRTVDTAHLLVTGTLSRRSLYVGLTRGRESNTAHIVTGHTAPPGHLGQARIAAARYEARSTLTDLTAATVR